MFDCSLSLSSNLDLQSFSDAFGEDSPDIQSAAAVGSPEDAEPEAVKDNESDALRTPYDVKEGVIIYLPDLKRRALSLTRDRDRAEELVQDAVLRALHFADKFVDGSQVRAWLMRILYHVFVSQMRRRKIEARVMERTRFDPNGWSNRRVPEPQLNLLPSLEKKVGALPDKLQRMIRLVDLHELSYNEAAEFEQVPVGTVMSRLHRGRKRLSQAVLAPVAESLAECA